jgi:acyl-CoA synthetase (NDP forming)
MFHPRTVAVVGPTGEPSTLAHKALAALTMGGFERPLVAVDSRSPGNPFEIRVYRAFDDVPDSVELAVVATKSDEIARFPSSMCRRGPHDVVSW